MHIYLHTYVYTYVYSHTYILSHTHTHRVADTCEALLCCPSAHLISEPLEWTVPCATARCYHQGSLDFSTVFSKLSPQINLQPIGKRGQKINSPASPFSQGTILRVLVHSSKRAPQWDDVPGTLHLPPWSHSPHPLTCAFWCHLPD